MTSPRYDHETGSGSAVVNIPDGAWVSMYSVAASATQDASVDIVTEDGPLPTISVPKGLIWTDDFSDDEARRAIIGPASITITDSLVWEVSWWEP